MKYFQRYFILLFILFILNDIVAQSISQETESIPLREVLNYLSENYNYQFSYNDELIKDCVVNNIDFEKINNPGTYLVQILSPCHLKYKNISGVFVISQEKIFLSKNQGKKSFKLSGRILDLNSNEPLPFSTILINNAQIHSDMNGCFAYVGADTIYRLSVSHLGYNSQDTILLEPGKIQIKLKASQFKLNEIIVEAKRKTEDKILLKDRSQQKINPQSTSFLPGETGNFLFNHLRLQPGILAAGEQQQDFIIWGSYKGQTQILFDGITLFSTSNSNNSLGPVNSFLIKDIEVFKGGYNVDIGDRVGGVVSILGQSGSQKKFRSKINLSDQSINTYLNIPVANKFSIQAGFRQTYTHVIDWRKIFKKEEDKNKSIFRDLNVKLSSDLENGDFLSINLINNKDQLSILNTDESFEKNYFAFNETNAEQLGGSLFYGKKWSKGNYTHLKTSYSQLKTEFENEIKIVDPVLITEFNISENQTKNRISHSEIRLEHFLPAQENFSLSFGGGYVQNKSSFDQDSMGLNLKTTTATLNRLFTYVKNEIRIHPKLTFTPGLRLDVPIQKNNPVFQPRFNLIYQTNSSIILNLSGGWYTQFISENAIVDSFNNNLFYWSVADPKNANLLKGKHLVFGGRYEKNKFKFQSNFYYKTTTGLTRFILKEMDNDIYVTSGKSRTYGIDLLIMKKIKYHDFWISYTLSKTEENFDYFLNNSYQRAVQDQRHELKTVGILNFNPFHFSVNYVYGSGIPNSNFDNTTSPYYSRLDASFLYRWSKKKIKFDLGCSLTNILNRSNILYNNFSNFSDNKTIYTKADPFTPSIFITIDFH